MPLLAETLIEYPSSDGKPMAESTLQYRWIVKIKEGCESLFKARGDVFVAADLLWYPVEGQPKISAAPDTMVVFGVQDYERLSYIQHLEDGIGPQVTFEIRSHTNTDADMEEKRRFYERYGVEEYYMYDPQAIVFEGWKREGRRLVPIPNVLGDYISPRLRVNFSIVDELVVTMPDGRFFETMEQIRDDRAFLASQRNLERAEVKAAKTDLIIARHEERQAKLRLEEQAKLIEAEKQRAEAEKQRAEQAEARAKAMEALLKAQGIAPP